LKREEGQGRKKKIGGRRNEGRKDGREEETELKMGSG
jgi:hypothetical protein